MTEPKTSDQNNQTPKLWRRLREQNGTTMVEFAVVATLLLTIVVTIIQGGFLFGAWLGITNGAREGARSGATCINRDVTVNGVSYGCSANDVRAVVYKTTGGFVDRSQFLLADKTIDPNKIEVALNPSISPTELKVTVHYDAKSITPWMGLINLSAESIMRLEYQK